MNPAHAPNGLPTVDAPVGGDGRFDVTIGQDDPREPLDRVRRRAPGRLLRAGSLPATMSH